MVPDVELYFCEKFMKYTVYGSETIGSREYTYPPQ